MRAFRKAVREAGNTFDGSESGTVDFDAAFAALAGGGMEQIPPQLCAPLLRPFATHWGGDQGKVLSEAPHDDAAPRKVAALLAASTGGQVQARSLELFLAETGSRDRGRARRRGAGDRGAAHATTEERRLRGGDGDGGAGGRRGFGVDAPRPRLPGADPVPGRGRAGRPAGRRRRRRPARCSAAVGALRRGGDADRGISHNAVQTGIFIIIRECGRSSSSGRDRSSALVPPPRRRAPPAPSTTASPPPRRAPAQAVVAVPLRPPARTTARPQPRRRGPRPRRRLPVPVAAPPRLQARRQARRPPRTPTTRARRGAGAGGAAGASADLCDAAGDPTDAGDRDDAGDPSAAGGAPPGERGQ